MLEFVLSLFFSGPNMKDRIFIVNFLTEVNCLSLFCIQLLKSECGEFKSSSKIWSLQFCKLGFEFDFLMLRMWTVQSSKILSWTVRVCICWIWECEEFNLLTAKIQCCTKWQCSIVSLLQSFITLKYSVFLSYVLSCSFKFKQQHCLSNLVVVFEISDTSLSLHAGC